MDRLSVVDEMFLRSHRGLGTPIAMQGLWRTSERFGRDELAAVHSALAHGPLGRRVVRSRVPGARPRWQPDSRAYPLAYRSTQLSTGRILEWADSQAPNLDPAEGPGWRMSASRLDDGGTVVSLVCSHVLADARGLLLAVDKAVKGQATLGAAQHTSDWADARQLWSTVTRGTARALGRIAAGHEPVPARESRPQRGRFHAQPSSAVLIVDADDWDLAARAHHGTPNTLFVAVVTNVLRASGWGDAPLTVALPVDTRTGASTTNAVSMTEVTLRQRDSLGSIRRQCRDAYAHPMTSPAGFPEELLQVLPDRLAYKLSAGAGERDVLCSNIGTLPAGLATVDGHRAAGIVARAIHPGMKPLDWQRLRTRLSGYLSRTGDRYALALVGLDPENIDSGDVLRELALAELDRWGLTAYAW